MDIESNYFRRIDLLAYFTLILIYFISGILRRRKLGKHNTVDELFPARRQISFFYFTGCLLFPYLLHPNSPDTWLFARSFWILYMPVSSALALRSYFLGNKKLRRLLPIGGLPYLLLLLFFIFACIGKQTLSRILYIIQPIIIIGASISTLYLLYVIYKVKEHIKEYNRNRFSNEENFPVSSEIFSTWIPLAITVTAWCIYFANSRLLTTGYVIFITTLGAMFLIIALKPHLHLLINKKWKVFEEVADDVSSEIKDSPESKTNKPSTTLPDTSEDLFRSPKPVVHKQIPSEDNTKIPKEMIDEIEIKIRDVVENQELYLDPNLNRDKLSEKLGINKFYLSIVFTNRFKSFYTYINTLRVEAFIKYTAEHPNVKREEAATQCGFGCARTFYRVKKLYDEGEL